MSVFSEFKCRLKSTHVKITGKDIYHGTEELKPDTVVPVALLSEGVAQMLVDGGQAEEAEAPKEASGG